MRMFARQHRAIAQSDEHQQEPPSLNAQALRRRLIRHMRAMRLRSPFSWQDYATVLLHIAVDSDEEAKPDTRVAGQVEPPVHIAYVTLGPGESARWVIQLLPGQARAADHAAILRRWRPSHQRSGSILDSVRYTLLLPELAEDEYLEHIAFHELGHWELGHVVQVARAVVSSHEMVRSALVCARADEAGGVTCATSAEQQWEQEAELFAVTLTRLARGWDPALAPPNMSHFFDFLM